MQCANNALFCYYFAPNAYDNAEYTLKTKRLSQNENIPSGSRKRTLEIKSSFFVSLIAINKPSKGNIFLLYRLKTLASTNKQIRNKLNLLHFYATNTLQNYKFIKLQPLKVSISCLLHLFIVFLQI